MTRRPDLELTEEERKMLESIEFNPLGLGSPEEVRENGERAAELFRLLTDRNSVPDVRLRVFSDDDYAPARQPALRDFERNGNSIGQTLRHADFLKHLLYFLSGPALPTDAIRSFKQRVDECGGVTSGDLLPLGRHAKQLAKHHGLDKKIAREEFFKLALECGLEPFEADSIRDSCR